MPGYVVIRSLGARGPSSAPAVRQRQGNYIATFRAHGMSIDIGPLEELGRHVPALTLVVTMLTVFLL